MFPKKSKQQKRQEKKEKRTRVKTQPKTQTPPAAKNKPQTYLSRIRILSWKTDLEGAALREKLLQTNADIVLLQGTNLANFDAIPDGYKLFHEPGNNGAIVLRKNIPAEEISKGQDQVQSLLIKLEKEFVLTNVANSTSPSFDPEMLTGIHERHLIGGDFGSGEMIQKFRADHMYKMLPSSAPRSNETGEIELQKHSFFLISPQLMPDFLTWRSRLMKEVEGSPLLLTWTVRPRNGVPMKGILDDREKGIRKQLRKRFSVLWKPQWKTGTRERPPFPTNIFIPEDLWDSCMEFWERHFEENLERLGKKLRGVIRERFIHLWRAQRIENQSLELPLFPQDIKIPVDELDSSMEYWERLWKENVDKIQKKDAKMNKWKARRGLAKKQPPKTPFVAANESSPLSSGIVTKVLSTCGYLFAKDYGKVFIPLKAVMRPTSTVDDMQLYLEAGDSVKFRAIAQTPTNNCEWAATHVEVEPDTGNQPDILRDKSGVVVKIADNGTYAFIKSEEHGTVFCPGSACVSRGEGKRLDEVFKVGDEVQFTAHVQPEKTGIRWFAVTATKLELQCSAAPMAWPQQNLQSAGLQDETRSSTTGLVRKRPWPSQEESAVPHGIMQATEHGIMQAKRANSSPTPTTVSGKSRFQLSQGLQQEQQDEQSKIACPEPCHTQDQSASQSNEALQQLSRWKRLAPLVLQTLQQPHQVPSLPSQTTQTLKVRGTVLNVSSPRPWPSPPDQIGHSSNRIQQRLQQPQQMPSQTAQTANVPGTVLNVSSGCAVVATKNLGHVLCPLASWTNSIVKHQQTTSLFDVLAIGDLVQIRATRDAPWQAWRAEKFCKQSNSE